MITAAFILLWVWAGATYAIMCMTQPHEERHPLTILWVSILIWWLLVPVGIYMTWLRKDRFPL